MLSLMKKGLPLLAAALLLSACGGNAAPPSATSAPASDTATASAPTTEPAAAGPVTINVWGWNPDATSVKPYQEAFEKANPNIKVNYRFMQYADYTSALPLGLQSNSGPDAFGLQVGGLTTQTAPFAEDLAPVFASALGSDWNTKMIAADQFVVDGKQVAMPWMVTGGGLVWANQTMIDSLKLKMPTNMSELVTFCKAVKAAGKDCWLAGAKDAWTNLDVYQSIMNQISPGLFYKAEAGQADWSSPEFVKGFDVWKSLFDKGIFQKGAIGVSLYPDVADAFHKGKAALMANGTWENGGTTNAGVKAFAESLGKDVDVNTIFMPYFFPQLVDGGTTGTMFGGPDVGWAVSSASPNKEAAATFVKWMTSSQEAQTLMGKSGQQPALASVPIDMSDVKTDAQKAAIQSQSAALAKMVGARQMTNPDVQTALSDALSAVASGQQSSADAAKAVETAQKAIG